MRPRSQYLQVGQLKEQTRIQAGVMIAVAVATALAIRNTILFRDCLTL